VLNFNPLNGLDLIEKLMNNQWAKEIMNSSSREKEELLSLYKEAKTRVRQDLSHYLVEQLTQIDENELLNHVKFECKPGYRDHCEHISSIAFILNNVKYLAHANILSKSSKEERAIVMERWIDIGFQALNSGDILTASLINDILIDTKIDLYLPLTKGLLSKEAKKNAKTLRKELNFNKMRGKDLSIYWKELPNKGSQLTIPNLATAFLRPLMFQKQEPENELKKNLEILRTKKSFIQNKKQGELLIEVKQSEYIEFIQKIQSFSDKKLTEEVKLIDKKIREYETNLEEIQKKVKKILDVFIRITRKLNSRYKTIYLNCMDLRKNNQLKSYIQNLENELGKKADSHEFKLIEDSLSIANEIFSLSNQEFKRLQNQFKETFIICRQIQSDWFKVPLTAETLLNQLQPQMKNEDDLQDIEQILYRKAMEFEEVCFE
jgi:hypothetical protein